MPVKNFQQSVKGCAEHKKFRFLFRKTLVPSLGVRCGYWPCLRGPFIQLAFGTRYLEFWYGLESHKNKNDKRILQTTTS